MVMKMKKREYVIMLFAVILCIGAWVFRPAFFQKDNGIIYAKTYDTTPTSSAIYNTLTQQEISNNIEKMKKNNQYTESDPLLIYNPYGTNTLSMYVYFETEEKASVSYTIHVNDATIGDFSRTINTDGVIEHEFQIIGMIPQMDNTITFHLSYADGTTKDYSYSYIMGGLLGSEKVILDKQEGTSSEEISDGLYVILGNDSSKDDFMYIYDNDGVIRGEIPIEEYRSHRLLFQNGNMYFSYNKTKIAAMNALGQITETYDLGDYELHHDYVFDDDGNMLILATDTTADTEEDMIISLNLSTKKVTLVTDLGDLLPDYKASTKKVDGSWDWAHLNTIQWLGDDEVIVSSRETSTIIKISDIYDKAKINYMIGEETFWEDTSYADLLLSKIGDFDSQAGQHSITYVKDESLDEGQYYLYMFNNNYGYSTTNTDYDWSQIEGCVHSKPDETAVSKYYRYLVDEKAGTYTLVDSFDVPFSSYVSSAQDIDGNTVIDSGTAMNFQEYDRQHQMIRSFDMEAENFIYRVYKYTFDGFYFNK